MKTILKIGWIILFHLGLMFSARAQMMLAGRVVSLPDSAALAGAVIKIKGLDQGVTTDENGRFRLAVSRNQISIQISYIGFKSIEKEIAAPFDRELILALAADENLLGEVVVSTGYQQIPKERATGSFSTVSNALLNRRVSTDIISRLDDVVPGLINNRGKGGAQGLLIRGQSTINSAARPLIVIDNFPYEGDLASINPNDIENVTVLKDAAAGSIWGSRAGNGVIVVTTKKGSGDRGPQITVNSNVSIGQRPDLFYQSRMSSADYIENERLLFESGRYNSAEKNVNRYPFTPVVELLMAVRDKAITKDQAESQISALKSKDLRNDYEKYLYQPSVSQQYAVGLRGGAASNRYYISAGYDQNRPSETANRYARFTVNANNTYQVGKNLEINAGINYSESKTTTANPGSVSYTNPLTGFSGAALYPYASLAGPDGNPLAVINEYRLSFLDQSEKKGLLDWQYRPLQEMKLADNTTKLTDYRFNVALDYKLRPSLHLKALYQYSRGISQGRNLSSQDSYMTRNLINRLTSIDSTGALKRNLPLGAILDQTASEYSSHNLRTQLDYDHSFKAGGVLTAIAGFEIRDLGTSSSRSRFYGYDDEFATSKAVDYLTPNRSFVNPASNIRVPYVDAQTGATDRYLSYYANGSYILSKKYIVSASARLDQSNLFGVSTNDKGVPLYSAGLAWNLSEERFYRASWLHYLKLRSTFGYSGNSNKNVSAFTTASFQGTDLYSGATYATIQNPPNPELRWEKVQTVNFAVDFESRNRVFSGSLEYYLKKGIDLIGSMPYPGSSGVKSFTGNYASTAGQGIDLALNARVFNKVFKWHLDLLFSRATDKVTKYALTSLTNSYLGGGDGTSIYPLEGRPLYAVYSLDWAGLDPVTGDPEGYLNGEISKDYASILKIAPQMMHYHGPARPKMFGSVRNSFSWRSLTLSINVNYRLGHYFRAKSLSYTELNNGLVVHGDYGLRWQKPGDELITSVPSKPQSVNGNRENFYAFSRVLVKRADNIRLQDINLSYNLKRSQRGKAGFQSAQLYLYANNLAILWKASKGNLDPDYPLAMFTPVRTLSAGIKLDL